MTLFIRVVSELHGAVSVSVTALEWQSDWKNATRAFEHLTNLKALYQAVSESVLRLRTRSKLVALSHSANKMEKNNPF